MKVFFIHLVVLLSTLLCPTQKPVSTIFLIGDSTSADKRADAFPETGWGTPFRTFFTTSVNIDNHAVNGRSTKSFIQEGRWESVLKLMKSGDYVFIQFGHNDEVATKVDRYTTPDEFQENLRVFIKDTRSKGGYPVLMTPVTRRSFENGVLIDTHEQYAQLVRDVASDSKVPMIDMTGKSMQLLNNLGEEVSKYLYHHLKPGEHPNYPDGKDDDTHFNELGARKMAQLVLEGIVELNLELKDYVVEGKK